MAESAKPTRVILVGIGGATCSGKTTLAKHLRDILPNSFIIHQDDFAPPSELVPIHPVYNIQDWDKADGAILWTKMVTFLREIKQSGIIPEDHYSHDHLNEQKLVPVGPETSKWKRTFQQLIDAHPNERVVFGLVDGFLLYWNKEVVDQLDVRVFLRVPEAVLKKRRHDRHGYHTAVQSDPEGSLWRDPPLYWEQIVYPAYVDAHQRMFEKGDIDIGAPRTGSGDGVVDPLVLIRPLDISMDEVVERCCKVLVGELKKL